MNDFSYQSPSLLCWDTCSTVYLSVMVEVEEEQAAKSWQKGEEQNLVLIIQFVL